jgi:hypothetical protein
MIQSSDRIWIQRTNSRGTDKEGEEKESEAELQEGGEARGAEGRVGICLVKPLHLSSICVAPHTRNYTALHGPPYVSNILPASHSQPSQIVRGWEVQASQPVKPLSRSQPPSLQEDVVGLHFGTSQHSVEGNGHILPLTPTYSHSQSIRLLPIIIIGTPPAQP